MLADEAVEASVSELRNDLLRHLPDAELFFPALTARGRLLWEHAMSNYVFVGVTADDPIQRLQRSKFVHGLVRTADRRGYERMTPAQMREVRHTCRPRIVRTGTPVRVLAGDSRGLIGKVVSVDRPKNRGEVEIQLHSRRFRVTLSLHELERA